MQHRDKIVLTKIISETQIAIDMVKDISFEEFNSSELLKRAVCMTVINIGELVKTLTAEIRMVHNTIPWKNIAGFRDIAAHKYQTLHMQDVYFTVMNDFPVLRDNIKSIFLTGDEVNENNTFSG